MVCGRGPSIGKKIRQAGRSIDDKVLQPIRPYMQEALTVVGTTFGGPLGATIGSTLGGMIEGQSFKDALASGAIAGVTGFASGATASANALGSGGFVDTLKGAFGGVKDFLSSPINTIKEALPSLSEVPDIAIDKIKAELQRLPENAMKSALEMLRGADPSQVAQSIQGGAGLMDVLGSIGQGVIANNASKDIIEENRRQFDESLKLQRETRDLGVARSEPFAEAGRRSLGALQDVANQAPRELGETGSTLEEVNPLVSLLRRQGFEDIQESAAAKGRLQSGGTLQDLVKFNTDLASTIVPQLQQQKFNEMLQRGEFARAGSQQQFGNLYDVARLGANAVANQNTSSSNAANNISNLRQNFAQTSADATANRANVLQGTIQDLLIRPGAPGVTPPPPNAVPVSRVSNRLAPSANDLKQVAMNQIFGRGR